MSFLKIKDKLINKNSIVQLITKDVDNIFGNDLQIQFITDTGNHIDIIFDNQTEKSEALDYILTKLQRGYCCDLYEFSKGEYINLHKVENIHIEKSNETTWIYVVLNDKKYMTEIFEYNKDFYDCFESPEDLLDEIEERVV